MYIQVRLLKGFAQPLTYAIPSEWNQHDLIGRLVRVPIKTQLRSALIVKQFDQLPADNTFEIRQAHALEPFPADSTYLKFIEHLSSYYQIESLHFIKRIQQFLVEKEIITQEIKVDEAPNDLAKQITLTHEQQVVVDFVSSRLNTQQFSPTVLHGVTGSGKTEVYKNLILQNTALKKTTILLLPEVTLAMQFERLLRAQLPNNIALFGFHSATGPKQKKLLWSALLQQQPILIIGVHLPILLPIANLGLIIVDEEHEVGYQEKKHPKVNSKEAAIWRAHQHNIPIVLGSATPSLATLYNVKTKGWHFYQLKNRFSGSFPKIKTVFLTDSFARKNFWISKELEIAIKDRLHKKEQTIIFLNRRGFSFFVQCKGCSFIFSCSNCSVSLTLHGANQLNCHYCSYSKELDKNCPSCKKDENQYLKKGIGTQQVVSILEKLFPQARIARADMDTTLKKKEWQKTVEDFHAGNIDILVGTHTITKGYHFPRVTLVGVLWADLNLHFPVYSAAETTLQQLIQVAGRAGRAQAESLVIVQSMINHPSFAYLNEIDYIQFFNYEVEKRKLMKYPPYIRFAEIELKHTHESIVDSESMHLMSYLLDKSENSDALTILGPAKPPVHKIKNTHARKIYVKGKTIGDIIWLYQLINKKKFKSQIFFTPNSIS